MADNTGSESRSRILCVKKILEEKTEETGRDTISIEEIIENLAEYYRIDATPRTVIKDIFSLNEFLDTERIQRELKGEDGENEEENRGNEYKHPSIIKSSNGKTARYYLEKRLFSYMEIRLIVDAVRSAKFISEEDSQMLLDKIYSLTNEGNIKKLKTQITMVDRVRTTNENVMDTVDSVYSAISENKQLKFRYLEWTHNRILEPKKNGAIYQISPWAITWNDGNYYVIGYDSQLKEIRQYRVDKMFEIDIIDNVSREGKKSFDAYNVSEIIKTTFNMYYGEKKKVKMRFHNNLFNVVFDRFGVEGTANIPDGEDHFVTIREVAISPQFFGWLAGLGDEAAVISPIEVAKEYANFLKTTYLNQEKVLGKTK